MNNILTVSQYEQGCFTSINEALEKIHPGDTLFIKNGSYHEKIVITTPNITICGEDSEKTVIFYDDYAKKIHADGRNYGTSRSASVRIDASHVRLENITIKNTSGNGRDFGQAIALFTNGDDITCKGCRFEACQDTLFTGPGTQRDTEIDMPPIIYHNYFLDCFICGDIDFIFGGAMAYFKNCEIYSKNNITEEDIYFEKNHTKGYATAACTWKGAEYGYIFEKCRFTGDCAPETVYLGRPWRQYAKTVIIECELGAHIKKKWLA